MLLVIQNTFRRSPGRPPFLMYPSERGYFLTTRGYSTRERGYFPVNADIRHGSADIFLRTRIFDPGAGIFSFKPGYVSANAESIPLLENCISVTKIGSTT